MQYTHGLQTILMKATGETEDGMETVTLTKKQVIAKYFQKRIDKITLEYQFYDKNDNLILRLPCHSPQKKDQFGRYKDDNCVKKILESNLFIF